MKHRPTRQIDPNSLLDPEQAAILLNVSTRTLRNWHASRAISAIKLGRVVRYDRETLLAEIKRFATQAIA